MLEENKSTKYIALRITAIYFILSTLWIVFSDQIVIFFFQDLKLLTQIQTMKGMFYIISFGAVLYFIISKTVNKLESSNLELKKSQTEYFELFQSSPDLILVINFTTKLIKKSNAAFLKKTGYKKNEVLEKNVDAFISDELINFLDETISNFKTKTKSDDYEAILETKNSPLNVICRITHINTFGNENICRLAFTDITMMKEKEKQLYQTSELLSSILENSPLVIWITSIEGKVIMVNKGWKELFNIYNIEMKEKSFEELVSPEIWEFHRTDNQNVNFVDDTFHYVKQIKRGEENLFFQVLKFPLKQEDGKVVNWGAVALDITELRKKENDLILAREKAEQLNNLKNIFLSNMSHELRTPMNGILGNSLILIEESSNADIRTLAENINYSGLRLLKTLNLLIYFATIESGKIDLNFFAIDIGKIVRQYSKPYVEFAVKKNLTFEIIIKNENLFVEVDLNLINEIIDNLVNNAIKFTEVGGVKIIVEKEVGEKGSYGLISISDTGIGIEKENIDVIFDDFRQASEGISRSYDGLGLGLTITKRLVEKMNGSLTINSEPQKGTTIEIRFALLSN